MPTDEKSGRRVTVESSPAAHTDPKDRKISELQARIGELEEELRDVRAGVDPSTGARKAPERASFGLSEGTRSELATRGVATDEHTGETLLAVDEGVDTSNPEAQRRMEKEQRRRERGDEPGVTTADTGRASGRHSGR
jgi:hypothetical protein